ncbi:MAG TPA: TonB family protein [Rhodanobacteraceae bacterium]|nr:TonB family protein [Rhodanobacteraceae bacterium]
MIDALGWTLLHFLWQGAAIGMLYAVARALSASPRTRYLSGIAALALCALSSAVTLGWLWPSQAVGATTQRLPDRQFAALLAPGSGAWHGADRVLPWLVAAWCAGVLLLAARSIWQWSALARTRRKSIPVDALRDTIDALSERFGVRRAVSVFATAIVQSPTLLGVFKPVILLPTALLLRLPPAQLELILAHELCHVRRWDYLVNLMQVVLETLLFYHPVVHWISSRVRADRELCCDETVVAVMGAPPRRYAQALAELAESASRLAPAASGGVLVERIETLLTVQRTRRAPAAWLPLLSAMVALLLAFGLKLALAPAATDSVTSHPSSVIPAWPARPAVPQPLRDAESPPATEATRKRVAAVPVDKPDSGPATVASLENAHSESASEESHGGSPGSKATGRVADGVRDVPAPAAINVDTIRIPAPKVEFPAVSVAVEAVSTPPASRRSLGNEVSARPADATAAQDAAPRAAPAVPLAMPQVVHFVAPVYPADLDGHAVQGRVDLQFTIAGDGSVQDVAVVDDGAHPLLAQAAVSALRQWRFAPGTALAGHVYRQAIDFDLAGERADSCRIPTGSHICRRDLDDRTAQLP